MLFYNLITTGDITNSLTLVEIHRFRTDSNPDPTTVFAPIESFAMSPAVAGDKLPKPENNPY